MNLGLTVCVNVCDEIVVGDARWMLGVDERGVVEVPLVGVLGDDVDVVDVEVHDVGELGLDECLDLVNGFWEGTGVHPGNAKGDGRHDLFREFREAIGNWVLRNGVPGIKSFQFYFISPIK